MNEKDTKKNKKDDHCKTNHRQKSVEEARPTAAFDAVGALFDVVLGADQAEGTAVPVQTLFIGVGKHRTIFIELGIVVAFTWWAATFHCQCMMRTGIPLAAVAKYGRIGRGAPVVMKRNT